MTPVFRRFHHAYYCYYSYIYLTKGQERIRAVKDAIAMHSMLETPSPLQLVIFLRFEAAQRVACPFWQHRGLLVQANADGISCLIEKQAQPHDHIEHGMRTA